MTTDDLELIRQMREAEQQATAALKRNRIAEALPVVIRSHQLAEALGDQARSASHASVAGMLLAELGDTTQALPWLEAAIPHLLRTGQRPCRAYLWLGRCLRAASRYADAVGAYRLAIGELDHDGVHVASLEARLEMAQCLLESGDPTDRQEAVAALHVAVEQADLLSHASHGWKATVLLARAGERSPGMLAGRVGAQLRGAAGRLARASSEADEAMARGDAQRAVWLYGHLVIGCDNVPLLPPDAALRLKIGAYLVLSQVAVRAGDLGRAIRILRDGEDALPRDLPQRGGRVRAAAGKLLGELAVLYNQAGRSDAAQEWARLAHGLVETFGTKEERVALAFRLAGAESDAEGEAAALRNVIALADRQSMAGQRCEALIWLARTLADPREALATLDQAASLLPQVAALRSVGPALAGALRDMIAAERLGPMTQVDPQRAVAEARSLPAVSSLGPLVVLARYRLDAQLERSRTSSAVAEVSMLLINQVEAAATWGERQKVFLSVRPMWEQLLRDLAETGGPGSARLALELTEVANRGRLVRLINRGATVGTALADAAVDSMEERLKVAVERAGGSSEPLAMAPEQRLGDRAAVAVTVVQRQPGTSLTGVRIVQYPGAEPYVEPFRLSGCALALLEAPRRELFDETTDSPAWRELSRALLGDRLSALLAGNDNDLVVVAGHPLLANLPWCAMAVDGMPVVTRAAVQIAPSLSVLSGAGPAAVDPGRALAYIVEYTDPGDVVLQTDTERAALTVQTKWSLTQPMVPDQLTAALTVRDHWQFGYFAAHGSAETGALVHADGSRLEILDALALWWPRTVVLSSCHLGRFKAMPATDPFGLPLACLLRGARTVIGCNESVSDTGAATIGSEVIRGLADGVPAPRAVQAAQQRWLSRRASALYTWAPFQVISLD